MKYEIITKSNPLFGINLLIKFPEDELDQKALYTLQHDWPEFLVPFRYQAVDGEIELTYQPGDRSKLRFFNGPKAPDEYVKFWERLLQPLLDCGDWFLKPFSMVMDPEYLYRDKSGVVSYLYVPAKGDYSTYEDLQNTMYQLGQENSVGDSQLENVVLHMLVKKVQPKVFLDTLQQRKPLTEAPAPTSAPLPPNGPASIPLPTKGSADTPLPHNNPAGAPLPSKRSAQASQPKPESFPAPSMAGDIVINLHGGTSGKKEELPKKQDKSGKKFLGGLFGGKKDKEGAPVFPPPTAAPSSAPSPIPQFPAAPMMAAVSEPVPAFPVQGSDETQLEEHGTGLRLVGMMGLPKMIQVEIAVGGIFTIGRYDVQLQQRQSSFEFPAGTKAVSRRHAAIERDIDGYSVTDLGSKAGTFVNGMPLKANFPYRLQKMDRISFGTSGADYVWEE